MKAVVLARGAGRRMRQEDEDAALTAEQRAAASAGHKGMMPVGADGSRPFLDYVLGSLADAGCRDVCLVVAPDHAAIRRYYEGTPPSRVRVQYAVQEAPTGTAHAVLAAEPFAGHDPFLVLNSDNLYPVSALRSLAALDTPGLAGFEPAALARESGFPLERTGQFAALEVDEPGWLVRIVEKPGAGAIMSARSGVLVSMNVWRFDWHIFDACRDVAPSPRGEYELPGAVALALSRGVRFRVVRASGAVLDLSKRSDVADVSRRLASIDPRP